MELEPDIKEKLKTYIQQLQAIFIKKHGAPFHPLLYKQQHAEYQDAIDLRFWTAQFDEGRYQMFQLLKNQNKLNIPFQPVPKVA